MSCRTRILVHFHQKLSQQSTTIRCVTWGNSQLFYCIKLKCLLSQHELWVNCKMTISGLVVLASRRLKLDFKRRFNLPPMDQLYHACIVLRLPAVHACVTWWIAFPVQNNWIRPPCVVTAFCRKFLTMHSVGSIIQQMLCSSLVSRSCLNPVMYMI